MDETEKSPYGEELEQKFECIKERIFLVDEKPPFSNFSDKLRVCKLWPINGVFFCHINFENDQKKNAQ